MNLLYLVPKATFDTKMSRVRFQQVAAIAQVAHVSYWGPGWPAWDGALTTKQNLLRLPTLPGVLTFDAPDAALLYDVDGVGAERLPYPLVTSYNEAYNTQKVDRYVRHNGISLVIFHHANDVERYWWWPAAIARAHIPHCADPAVYRDYGEPKVWDITVAGNLNDHFYPFRYRLASLARQHFAKRGYKVRVLPHPGYTLPPREGTLIGEAFARALNASRIVFTCSMRFNYALAKYTEIALCRALPVGDLPAVAAECRDNYRQLVYGIEPSLTDEQITRKVEDLLDDQSGLLQTLTNQAWDVAGSRFTMAAYAARFLQIVRDHCAHWERA